jgi:hypothetical protein
MRGCAAFAGMFVLLTACPSPAWSGEAIQPDPVYRETELRHARPRLNGEVFDTGESDPALTEVFASADRKAERQVGNTPRDDQFITTFWAAKQRLLESEYGVSWRTPAELNPQIRYANYGQPELTGEERRVLGVHVSDRKQATESIREMFREFDGTVRVSTWEPQTDTVRHYTFVGHDTEWTFVDVGELEE